MELPEIEQLVSQAIDSRPSVTNSPMNLYIYGGRLICGARSLMPPEADFVSHVPPYQFQNGFSDNEWKLIVEKIKEIAGAEALTAGAVKKAARGRGDEVQHRPENGEENFEERRSEQRLNYHRAMWFGNDFNETVLQGRMVDVSSGGMAFTCGAEAKELLTGEQALCAALKRWLNGQPSSKFHL